MEPYYAMFGPGMATHGTAYPILRKLGGIQAGDPQISLPDKMKLFRQKVTQGLNRSHERAKKAYNTRSKLVEFSVGQVVYRKNYNNLHFKLKHKIAEDEFVELLKDNMNSQKGGITTNIPNYLISGAQKRGSQS